MKRNLVVFGILLLVWGTALPAIAQNSQGGMQIDAIDSDSDTIVLGDMVFKIADDAKFYASSRGASIALSQFEEGDWVGVIVNSDREIVEMWLSSE